MSRHAASPDRRSLIVLTGLALAGLLYACILLVTAMDSAKQNGVGIPTDTTITAEATTISYEAPQVTTTAAPPAPTPAPPPTYPIPPCAQDNVGPGVAPCHWDSGQYGGGESYVWTGEYKITLIEPRP